MKLLKLNLICITNCTTSKQRTEIWTIEFFSFLKLKNLSSAGKKTTRFLSARVCHSYVPYVRCVGWKPRLTHCVWHVLHCEDARVLSILRICRRFTIVVHVGYRFLHMLSNNDVTWAGVAGCKQVREWGTWSLVSVNRRETSWIDRRQRRQNGKSLSLLLCNI